MQPRRVFGARKRPGYIERLSALSARLIARHDPPALSKRECTPLLSEYWGLRSRSLAGGSCLAGLPGGEIRFGEAVGSAAASFGGIQAAASSGEAASGSATDAVEGKRRREEGGEAEGSESGAAGEGTQQALR